MKKDDEESKKKVFNHIKRIKENAVRRNRTRLSSELGTNAATISDSSQPETTNPNNQTTSRVATDQNQDAAVPNVRAANTQAAAQPLVVDLNASNATPSTSFSPAKSDKKTGESEAATSAPDDNNCSICLRENTNPALCNECFHCFCFPCIQQWSEQSNQCPVCRREYGLILHNIRSETEYDQLPVQPRRRVSEFEIILPLNNFFEMDEALTRFLQVPPLLQLGPPMQNPFLHANPAAALLPPTRPPIRGRDPENPENMISLSVTNYNQPDANGNRVIQRTFFFSEPSALDQNQGAQPTTQTNMNTPSTSLEQNQPHFGEPLLQLGRLQDPMQQRQPTVVFNPSYGAEPYRSLASNLDRFILPSFSTLPPSTTFPTGTSDGRPTAYGQQPMQTLDSIFERIFNDLTRFPVAGVGHPSLLTRRSFPTSENSANSTQVDPTESTESLEDPAEQADTSSTYSVIIRDPRPRGRRGRGRGRGRRAPTRRPRRQGRGRGSRGGNSRSRNRSTSRRGRRG